MNDEYSETLKFTVRPSRGLIDGRKSYILDIGGYHMSTLHNLSLSELYDLYRTVGEYLTAETIRKPDDKFSATTSP